MSAAIIDEYKELLLRKNEIEKELPSLPKGYISTKMIHGRRYYYLQNRVDGKITSRYLKEYELEPVKEQLECLKKYKEELPKIEIRLKDLEKAAGLIDKSIARYLIVLKLSYGMDEIERVQKERSSTFAHALNAIEGVPASETTKQNIEKWKQGQESYISILLSTLKMYGFKTEA